MPAWLAPALMLGGAGLSAFGSYRQAQTQGDIMDFNARQTAIDAQIARQNARAQAQFIRTQGASQAAQGREEAKMIRKQGRALEGRQRTRYAKAGLRLEGTPLEVMAQTIEDVELDAINRRQGALYAKDVADWQAGLVERAGAFQAGQLMTQSKFLGDQAGATRKAGTISAISGLISGGAGAMSMGNPAKMFA